MAVGFRAPFQWWLGLAGVTNTPPPATVGFRSIFPFAPLGIGGVGGGGGGSTVIFFSGVSQAGGVSSHQGVSRPNIALTDAGGGKYNVTKTHHPEDFTEASVSRITYIIDGELP